MKNRVIYVQAKDGSPLMPMNSERKARLMLKDGRAKMVSAKPFVLRLQYETPRHVQPLYGGLNPGRTNIGIAVVNGKGEALYAAEARSRNREIPKLMQERATHRRASRRGERQARKRLARRHGTTTSFPEGRKLPGYADGVMALKDIINTEARFSNRKKPTGWLTPTARHCIQTHTSLVRLAERILPVSSWTLERNRLDFISWPVGVRGLDLPNNHKLKNLKDAKKYIYEALGGRCACCPNPIAHYHHCAPRSKDGCDWVVNIIGLCAECHAKIHTNELNLNLCGVKKEHAGLSILNIAWPYIWQNLCKTHGSESVHICQQKETKAAVKSAGVLKTFANDAIATACVGAGVKPADFSFEPFKIIQFRNHARARIHSQTERTYKLDSEIIAKNRNPRFEQKGPALSDWVAKMRKMHGEKEAALMLSRLTVVKSKRRYSNPERLLPGAIFRHERKSHIIIGQLTNGRYYRACGLGEKNFPARNCVIISKARSLVYVWEKQKARGRLVSPP